MKIRQATIEDSSALSLLWTSVGLSHRKELVAEELGSVLSRDPDIVLVAEDASGLAGSVFGAYDGRRAWVNRLATRPDMRNRGLATQLMQSLEHALKAKGCRKINLLIESEDGSVARFYERLGYTTDELIFMEKRIDD